MGGWQKDQSWDCRGHWDEYSGDYSDDGDSYSGWQEDTSWARSGGGGGTHGNRWDSGSWGVHPGSSSPQGHQWPTYCTPQLPTPPPPPPFLASELVYQTQPQFTVQRPPGPPLVQLMPGCIAGFQQGYEAAHKAGCKQSRAASPAWWEDVVRGGEGGGDKKKQKQTCAGSFAQWLNEYHKKHPL